MGKISFSLYDINTHKVHAVWTNLMQERRKMYLQTPNPKDTCVTLSEDPQRDGVNCTR